MRKILEKLLLLIFVVVFQSCNINEDLFAPKINLDSENGIYTVKYGRELIIAPTYEHAEDATYSWTIDGVIISFAPSLSFKMDAVGEYYVTLTVRNDIGKDEEEIRIDVVELEVPTVSIAGNKKMTVTVGTVIPLTASVRETSLPTTFVWTLNDEEVSEDYSYTFLADEIGRYTLKASASNEDGSHSDMVEIEVVNAEDIPFELEFEKYDYHTVVGRKLLLKPLSSNNAQDVEYSWNIDEMSDINGSDSQFIFSANKAGEYHVNITATSTNGDNVISFTRTINVTVYDEKEFYRPKSGASVAECTKVFEYTPAPGQFINELKTGGFDASHTTQEAAIAYAEDRFSVGNWVLLRGFGGYVIVGFDHSIDNTRSHDLCVIGNSFNGSSEPGVVWVMQDENGNGLPDDTWYELAGSETGKVETIQNYAVTYYRPTGTKMPVQWTDNYGNSGEIDYLKQFHTQDYYYPLWVEEDTYTLTGTCLKARNYDQSGNGTYWVNPHYDWGYVDNFSPTDFISSNMANHFNISNAIDFEGEHVNLSHIDFVKVQCAINAKSGWLGELSTEVCGFYDSSLKR